MKTSDLSQLMLALDDAMRSPEGISLEMEHAAGDLIKKLCLLRARSGHSDSVDSLCSHPLTPPLSAASSTSSCSVWSSEPLLLASAAFDREIYARCVQIVEKAAKTQHIDNALLSLAHRSYSLMVASSECTSTASKMCGWWVDLLESQARDRRDNDRLQCMQWLSDAVEKRFDVDSSNRGNTVAKLVQIERQIYKMTSVFCRPFHRRMLATLDRVAEWSERAEEYGVCDQSTADFIADAVTETQKDEKKYRHETRGRLDANYEECCSVLDRLSLRVSVSDSPSPAVVDDILSKVFPSDWPEGSSLASASLPPSPSSTLSSSSSSSRSYPHFLSIPVQPEDRPSSVDSSASEDDLVVRL